MKKSFSTSVLGVLMLSILIGGCANLRAINDFSSDSLRGVQKFEQINYSFTQHCHDRCVFEATRKFEIKRSLECDCDIYKKADTVTMLIYNSIRGYLIGLTNLSGNNLANYNLDTLKRSLTEGNFGDIKIGKEQVNAYGGIAQILLNAVAGAYRIKKIKLYVEQANKPIQILLNKFQFILQKNLNDELNFKKEKLFAFYRELLLNNDLTEYEKGKATTEYYEQVANIDRTQQEIDLFAGSLVNISEGHQKIYDNRNKLTARELKNLLVGYQSNISNMISHFNKLKN
jgi:hypothetical protein